MRFQQLFQALVDLSVIAHGLSHMLAEEEHPMLQLDHNEDDQNQSSDTYLSTDDQVHRQREHRECEDREQKSVGHQYPFGPPPFGQVRSALAVDMGADMTLLVVDRPRVLHSVDIG